jgi:hypothetical protein
MGCGIETGMVYTDLSIQKMGCMLQREFIFRTAGASDHVQGVFGSVKPA